MIRNLTPHTVNVVTTEGQVQIHPDAPPARLRQNSIAAGSVDMADTTVALFNIATDGVEDLPESQPNVWLIVSRIVAENCPQRSDLVFPYREVRDGTGRIIACSAFGRVARKDY